MAAIVQRLERLIVVQDVVGSNPTSRPIYISMFTPPNNSVFLCKKRILAVLISVCSTL